MSILGRTSILRSSVGLLLGALAVGGSGCRTGCDAILGINYAPVDTTIRIGQSFQPVVRLTTCGGTQPMTEALRYSAADSAIVQVDSLSGTATGRAVGHTNLLVTSAASGGFIASIGVTVQ